MKCDACQYKNDDDDQFCAECGAPLIAHCSNCEALLKPNAKFCTKCGTTTAGVSALAPEYEATNRSVVDYTPKHLAERILTSRSAIEGERKRVTVLFADVKGSMNLAAQLGADGHVERIASGE